MKKVEKEKSQHHRLLNLLKKHFEEDEIEMAIDEMEKKCDEEYEKDEMDEEYPDDEEMEDDEDEEGDDEVEEEKTLPKSKRKGLAVAIIQKRMSKPKKDM